MIYCSKKYVSVELELFLYQIVDILKNTEQVDIVQASLFPNFTIHEIKAAYVFDFSRAARPINTYRTIFYLEETLYNVWAAQPVYT